MPDRLATLPLSRSMVAGMSVSRNRLSGAGIRLSAAIAADYFALMKPRVMALAVFTAFVGMLVAPGVINPAVAIARPSRIALGAGAAGVLNMWYDMDVDAVMSRTVGTADPVGTRAPADALNFGLLLATLSVMMLEMLVGWLAASLLAFTIFFYVVVYTMWLKRSTPQNIVIGGAAGALPPVIGWAAATNTLGIESLILFLITFLWTPPHFWALALFKVGDYAKAGIPMMPNVAGELSTRRQIFAYSLLLAPVGMLPWAFGFATGILRHGIGRPRRRLRLVRLETARRPRRRQEPRQGALRLLDPLSLRDLCRAARRHLVRRAPSAGPW